MKSKKGGSKNSSFINIFMVIIIILLFIGILIAYNKYKYKFETFTDNKKITIQYYYMDGCCHCDDFMDTWNEFVEIVKKDEYRDKYNTEKIKLTMDMDNKFEITGTPTIIAVRDDKKISEFNLTRTVENLVNYINSLPNV